LTAHSSGAAIGASYSAQFYDLTALHRFAPPVVELGRFSMVDGAQDPDILRLAFAGMARVVQDSGAGLLFGCASFAGHDGHLPALDALRGHLAPPAWRILRKSPKIVEFADRTAPVTRDGMRAIPPLLRNYLALGGWVSDHAVADHALNTLHVFTGVMIDEIPAPRAALLREMAQKITLG
jgi:putative hemolysin